MTESEKDRPVLSAIGLPNATRTFAEIKADPLSSTRQDIVALLERIEADARYTDRLMIIVERQAADTYLAMQPNSAHAGRLQTALTELQNAVEGREEKADGRNAD